MVLFFLARVFDCERDILGLLCVSNHLYSSDRFQLESVSKVGQLSLE